MFNHIHELNTLGEVKEAYKEVVTPQRESLICIDGIVSIYTKG